MSKFMIAALAGAAALALASPASAGVFGDALSRCLVEKASAKDKDDLVIWVWSAMSRHPRVIGYTNLTDEQRKGFDKAGAVAMQRLLVVDCRKDAVAALKYEGVGVMETSFQVLGEVASGGLMDHPDVSKGMESFVSFFDLPTLTALFKEAGIATAE